MTGPITTDRREALMLGAGSLLAMSASAARARGAEAMSAVGKVDRGQPWHEDWRFYRGSCPGFERADFDDSTWRAVDLPHDWSIEDIPGGSAPDQLGPFDKHAIGGTATGFTVGGEGCYRKHFRWDGEPDALRAEIEFDGVYCESDVWLNGVHLGGHLNGYAPFAFDMTPYLVNGANVVAVHARNQGRNSRWYAGSGIYRLVWLNVTPATTRIARWGVNAWTKRVSGGAAEVEVVTLLDDPDATAVLVTRLRDADGRVVAEAATPAAAKVRQSLKVRGAHLWSPTDPYLHSLESEVHRAAAVTDRMAQGFGIRIIAFDTHRGLTVNGDRVVVRGGCIHHDNGLLGACAYPQADDRRVRLMQARGYNAIRSSHNPMSRSLLDACDRHGMLVINEAFDCWQVGKNPDDYSRYFATDWKNVIDAMVLSSRNHPSVCMWSVGNEIPDRSSPEGIKWEWTLANAVRELDPSRPVTAALNGLLGPEVVAGIEAARPGHAGERDNASSVFLDVAGYNYRLENYEPDHVSVPSRIMVATESYPKEAWNYVELSRRAPYALGEFVWTAIDYLGEAAIGSAIDVAKNASPFVAQGWPWVISGCGDLDLVGNQKMPSRFRDVAWGISRLEMAVHRPVPEGTVERVSKWGWPDLVQSWTWPGREGRPLDVYVYTVGDRVEVVLNGSKVGEAKLSPGDNLQAVITVPYAAGVIEAVAYRSDQEIARSRLDTAGAPSRLRIRPEAATMGRQRLDLGYLAIDVLDAAGRLVTDAEAEISLAIVGPSALAGFGNGSPLAQGSFQQLRAKCSGGQALAILRGKGEAGAVQVTAASPGLTGAGVSLQLV